MRLKQFLQESITQQEFAGVLKNKNLMAGCEFEFYLDKNVVFENSSSENTTETQIRSLEEELGEIEDEITEVRDRIEHIKYGTDKYDANIDILSDLFTEKERVEEAIYALNDILESGIDISRIANILEVLNFPLDWSNVTTDENSKNPLIWKVVNDISLKTAPEFGVEVVTPVMQISKLINKIEEVFSWMKKHKCWTDHTCGFHVHISLKPSEHSMVDPVKLMLFTEEGLIYKDFKDRIGNKMASALKEVHTSNDVVFNQKTVKQVLNNGIRGMSKAKFSGLHLIDLESNHVEFRYMGAKDYHKKFDFVKTNVVNYGHWMSIACDVNYKRKEYVRKVALIVNKFNAVADNLMIEVGVTLLNNKNQNFTKIQKNKLKLNIQKKKRKLKSLGGVDQELYDKIPINQDLMMDMKLMWYNIIGI